MPQHLNELDSEISPVLAEREEERVQRTDRARNLFVADEPEDEFAIRVNTMFSVATTWKR